MGVSYSRMFQRRVADVLAGCLHQFMPDELPIVTVHKLSSRISLMVLIATKGCSFAWDDSAQRARIEWPDGVDGVNGVDWSNIMTIADERMPPSSVWDINRALNRAFSRCFTAAYEAAAAAAAEEANRGSTGGDQKLSMPVATFALTKAIVNSAALGATEAFLVSAQEHMLPNLRAESVAGSLGIAAIFWGGDAPNGEHPHLLLGRALQHMHAKLQDATLHRTALNIIDDLGLLKSRTLVPRVVRIVAVDVALQPPPPPNEVPDIMEHDDMTDHLVALLRKSMLPSYLSRSEPYMMGRAYPAAIAAAILDASQADEQDDATDA